MGNGSLVGGTKDFSPELTVLGGFERTERRELQTARCAEL